MAPRLDVTKYPDALKAMYGLDQIAHTRGIEPKLLHLIKSRVSQISGCAYCIDMHTKDARAEDETEQRLYGLSAWRETPVYTPPERGAPGGGETLAPGSSPPLTPQVYPPNPKHLTPTGVVRPT